MTSLCTLISCLISLRALSFTKFSFCPYLAGQFGHLLGQLNVWTTQHGHTHTCCSTLLVFNLIKKINPLGGRKPPSNYSTGFCN